MDRLLARLSALSLAVILIVAVVFPVALKAQAVRGTLLGNITDQAGLAMPGVSVTATEVNTNISATTVTNESGYYTFNLRDGVYRVSAELSGFKKTVREGVEVDVNTTVRVDLKIEVGVIEESITVVAQTPLLQTDRADTGRIIEGMLIQAVPLGFNRNFQGMLVTVPGATRPFRPHSEFFNAQDSLSTNVNGQSRLANNVQLEGVDDNHKTGLLTVLVPSAEAIETVSVSTSNYDAEFGRAGGAITNVTLKSGTNAFKGSVLASAIPRRRWRRDISRTSSPRRNICSRALRWAARSRSRSCSSSATIRTRSMTWAARRAPRSRPRRSGTATSAPHRQSSMTR